MLLIQAIRHLILELEAHLKTHAKATGTSEKTLAEKLKASVEDTKKKKPEEVPVAEAAEVFEKGLIEQLAALTLIEVNDDLVITKNEKELKLALLTLPSVEILKKTDSVLYQQKLATIDAQTDATQLHFGITWGRFMTTTAVEFEGKLDTSLKGDDLADNKLYILARFKRQLELLSAYALKMLEEREKALNHSQGKFTFEERNSIDNWLISMVNECVTEAMHLSQKAMDNKKVRITKNITYQDTPCETEAMLTICKQVIEEFFNFCAHITRTKEIKTTEQTSLIDLLPKGQEKYRAIRLVNEKAAQDLVVRLFKVAHSAHYPKGMVESVVTAINPFGFSPTVASDKCEELKEALLAFEDIAKKFQEETPDYWEALLGQSHKSYADSKLHGSQYSWYTPQSTIMWQQVHSGLVTQAPYDASAKVNHQSCKL